ncbi:four helix bundle protein [Dokdonia pacifica]|uniref:Four helix bundle protein n=1 Tax=Dokdonia pacifica TaxID=1627892 RepID=A0A239CY97_9FLAO|nr:four helix bundle protein [Dokdonia pacifica]SNS24631.1 four helix bundle protein [Dokdonia pacifica]
MTGKRHNYKNLKIWKVGLEIAKEVSDLLEAFPKHERYDLTSQISRCSISIPSNISEGSSRTNTSFSHFIDIALGSSFELGTQLLIAKHKKYIDKNILEDLEEKIAEWQRMTMSFQNGLKK